MHRSPHAPSPSRTLALRLEVSRMVLFALLLMSAFLSSMVHIGAVSKLDTFTPAPGSASHSRPAAPATHR